MERRAPEDGEESRGGEIQLRKMVDFSGDDALQLLGIEGERR